MMNHSKSKLPISKSHRVIAPRIAYIVTSVDEKGRVNAGVFSNLTSVSTDPERLVLGVYKEWDTIKNIRQTKEFVVNVPSKDLIEQVWICGDKYAGNPIPRGINELRIARLTEIPSEKVKPPRIAECYAHLECKVVWVKDVGNHFLVLGEIIAASFSPEYLNKDFIVNIDKAKPLMEISRGLFTFPVNILQVNRGKVSLKVKTALKKNNIKIPKKLKIYEREVISEQ